MSGKSTTLHQWFKRLKDPVPVNMIPTLTGLKPLVIRQAINKGNMQVHRFKARTGQVFEVVTLRDVQAFRKSINETKQMQQAMLNVFKRWVTE